MYAYLSYTRHLSCAHMPVQIQSTKTTPLLYAPSNPPSPSPHKARPHPPGPAAPSGNGRDSFHGQFRKEGIDTHNGRGGRACSSECVRSVQQGCLGLGHVAVEGAVLSVPFQILLWGVVIGVGGVVLTLVWESGRGRVSGYRRRAFQIHV